MPANYLKILGRDSAVSKESVIDIITFDDSSLEDTKRAWEQAEMLRGFTGKRRIVPGYPIPLSGPWDASPVTFISGVDAKFLRDYR